MILVLLILSLEVCYFFSQWVLGLKTCLRSRNWVRNQDSYFTSLDFLILPFLLSFDYILGAKQVSQVLLLSMTFSNIIFVLPTSWPLGYSSHLANHEMSGSNS